MFMNSDSFEKMDIMYVASLSFFFLWHGLFVMIYLFNLEREAKYIDLQFFFLLMNWVKLVWEGVPLNRRLSISQILGIIKFR